MDRIEKTCEIIGNISNAIALALLCALPFAVAADLLKVL